MMETAEVIPHLFRTEYRKLVSVLCKRFGFDQLETAEDIASETFLTASQSWGLQGVPPNPVAWLHHVAKNKAKNYLLRSRHFKDHIVPGMQNETDRAYDAEVDLSPQNIIDSQLQMMFVVCHPAIPSEAQVGLSLRVLCGFGIDEIATAFLSNRETINKRLFRARAKLREENIGMEMPDSAALDDRLENVLTTIYLLFNEGYYSVSQDKTVRKELCMEAMRLCQMLVENETTDKPQVNALLALMCFHASRFEARIDPQGELILYDDQDTNLWNIDLVSKGGYFLNRAKGGTKLSRYHIEAAIAWWHTQKEDTHEKWENILQLFNTLLQIEYSPMAALNRTYALSRARSKQEAIMEAEKLNLNDNHLYFLLLGYLYMGLDDQKARQHFETALSFAKTETDQRVIRKKLDLLKR